MANRGHIHLLPSIMAASKIVRKRIKRLIWHQSDQYVPIKCNWWKPSGGDNRGQRSWCPTLYTGVMRKQSSWCLVASERSWSTLSSSLRLCCLATYLNSAGLAHSASSNDHGGKSSLAAQSPIPMPGSSAKKTNRQFMCAFYLCLNKNIRAEKKKVD